MRVLHARRALTLFILERVCLGFTVPRFKRSENLPPRIQRNKYAWLVILLQRSLPADR